MTHKEERRRSTDKLADIICACETEKLKLALADSEAEVAAKEKRISELEFFLFEARSSLLSVREIFEVKSLDYIIDATANVLSKINSSLKSDEGK